MSSKYIAIHQQAFLARGTLTEIIIKVKQIGANIEPIVIAIDDCKRIEFSWYGDTQAVLDNLTVDINPASVADVSTTMVGKRGRPKLGVKSKEVTLLPRHWDWLASQRGGASATLRRLVEAAQKNISTPDLILMRQQQLDKFMLLFLGDEVGYEEASRALYRNSRVSFNAAIQSWPTEINAFVLDKFNQISALHAD